MPPRAEAPGFGITLFGSAVVLKAGTAVLPPATPNQLKPAAVLSGKVITGVVVEVATNGVNKMFGVGVLTLVTVPAPPPPDPHGLPESDRKSVV